jgi:hypothetical protein
VLQGLFELCGELQVRQEQIGTHRHHDLRDHGVIGHADETLEFQVLLNPFKEQLHLPTLLVNLRHQARRPIKTIRDKHIILIQFGIMKHKKWAPGSGLSLSHRPHDDLGLLYVITASPRSPRLAVSSSVTRMMRWAI